eukprot:g26113.t1
MSEGAPTMAEVRETCREALQAAPAFWTSLREAAAASWHAAQLWAKLLTPLCLALWKGVRGVCAMLWPLLVQLQHFLWPYLLQMKQLCEKVFRETDPVVLAAVPAALLASVLLVLVGQRAARKAQV